MLSFFSKLSKNRPGTVQNPEYFENGNRDDPYAIIDDSRLHVSIKTFLTMDANSDRQAN